MPKPSDLGYDPIISLTHDTFMDHSPSGPVNLLDPSRTSPMKTSKSFPTPESDFPYMNLILRTIPDLLMISRIPSETPNNIRSLTHHSITTQQPQILKCVHLRFVNYPDMTETLLRSITNRGIWKFIWLPHISTITLRSNEPLTYDTNFPLSHDSLLIRGYYRRYLCIPSSTSLPISTLFSFP